MRTRQLSDSEDGRSPTPRSTLPKSHFVNEETEKEPDRVYPGLKIIIPVMLSLYIIMFLVALVNTHPTMPPPSLSGFLKFSFAIHAVIK